MILKLQLNQKVHRQCCLFSFSIFCGIEFNLVMFSVN